MEIVVPAEFKPLWETSDEQPVVKYPADVLRRVAEPVERVGKKTRELIERMERVRSEANGIGLAAPQIGVSERVILIAADGGPTALINPEIVGAEGEEVGQEGCLSLPGLFGDVKRSMTVEVKALDNRGKAIRLSLEGLAARVLQHEIDHLDGILFIDKVDAATLHWSWPAEERVG
ncbi:MAG: peptide deformylase [Armatimonadetes bacterium]|nr:peptide deformylase [Armatimonadota bacterium]